MARKNNRLVMALLPKADSMRSLRHVNFHTLRRVLPGKGNRKQMFILAEWRPKKDIHLVGASIGLLCEKSDQFELYLAISQNPTLRPRKYLVGLKRDWLFYAQRDVYTYSTGPGDLMSHQFLPSGYGFLIKAGQPVYIKVGVVNLTINPLAYDAFCNLYYVDA